MKRRILGIIAVASILASSLLPMCSFAVPTGYSGSRIRSGSGYYSHTYSNGYEAGGNVTNTVMAEMTGDSTSRRTLTGFGPISVNSAVTTGTAYHGVGTGSSIQKTWYEN